MSSQDDQGRHSRKPARREGAADRIRWWIKYILYLSVVLALADIVVLRHLLGLGYPRHYEIDDGARYPAPYIAFKGTPNVGTRNELGFRGAALKDAPPGSFTIAFFGGSTGYAGSPTIPAKLEEELAGILDINVFVANYSVVSSHHRQHLHAILEYLSPHKPDLVIFYGGYNETVQSAYYDPRPGYPYDFFYRAETGPLTQLLVENSACIGALERRFGFLTGLRRLREEHVPFSDPWNHEIENAYFETLALAATITRSFESAHCGHTKFLAFYQPYRIPEPFLATHERIRKRVAKLDYAFDVSSAYSAFGDDIYTDAVHVDQEAKNAMAVTIASIIAQEMLIGSLADCGLPLKHRSE